MKTLRLALCAAGLAAGVPALCADEWNAPQEPFALFGNTYYVGTHGLSSVLITSPAGHILIDGGSPDSPVQIAQHVRQLGFKVEDIKYILNSHEHVDHAGGIAELQRLSGASVLTSSKGAEALRTGLPSKADPQYSDMTENMAPIAHVQVIADGAQVKVGQLRVTAHYTPGHAPGGVSWTWTASEKGVTANMVYADSLNAITAKPFAYRSNTTYPAARDDLTRSIETVAALPCDILVSAHPEGSDLWERLDKASTAGHAGFIDRNACRAYAARGSARLAAKLAEEGAAPRAGD